MASSDLRDVLNLPDGASGPRPSKKQKTAASRPSLKGLAREVHMLGGDNPIAIVPEVTQFKKRRLINRKPAAKWELRAFRNSARDDSSLILRHWRRKEDKATGLLEGSVPSEPSAVVQPTAPGTEPTIAIADTTTDNVKSEPVVEDSMFAKFNAQVPIPDYSDDQYQQSLQNSDWTKAETDYLIDLARAYDLRWPIIWDRYDWSPVATNGEATDDGDETKAVVPTSQNRTMEDLKARYYEIAAKMMAVTKPVQFMTQQEFALHELMAHFNPQQEKARKEFAINSMNRSREEAREEESLLLEIKRILARSERFNEERRELYRRLDYPHTETDISTFRSSAGLQSLLQNLMTVDKSKRPRKSLMASDGVSPSGTAAPPNPQAAQEAGSRRDSTAASAAGGHRDSVGAATPTTGGKKGQQAPQPAERRKLTEQEEAIYGVVHFDRLGSGPTFRTEKINKLFSHKSNQQAIRINNALSELDVPARLAMATSATTQQYEQLLASVNILLDARKQSDKLDADLKVEQAKKAERDKLLNPHKTEDDGQDQTETTEGTSNGAVPTTSTDTNGVGAEEAANATVATANEEAADVADAAAEEKDADVEADDDATARLGEKDARPPSSSANHKRSASVMSGVSDKSSKRQRK